MTTPTDGPTPQQETFLTPSAGPARCLFGSRPHVRKLQQILAEEATAQLRKLRDSLPASLQEQIDKLYAILLSVSQGQ